MPNEKERQELPSFTRQEVVDDGQPAPTRLEAKDDRAPAVQVEGLPIGSAPDGPVVKRQNEVSRSQGTPPLDRERWLPAQKSGHRVTDGSRAHSLPAGLVDQHGIRLVQAHEAVE